MTWYEELGFDSNPFTIKPQESFVDFFGESENVEKVLEQVGKGSVILVTGKYGTGKTTVMKAIIEEFKGKRKVAYYNCYTSEKNIDYEDILIKGGNWFSRLFNIRSKEMILLLDEAHNLLSKDLEELPEYFNEGYFKSIILVTSRDNFKWPKEIEDLIDGNRFRLNMFGEEDAMNLVANRLEDVADIIPEEMVKKIYKLSSTPREFLMRCEDACKNAIERGSDVVEPEDIE